ncbi:type II toxin-antitoxin system HicB family antitoxin [Stenotrophomonas maltophilia]|uniref:type II toxin-antitoxin system HicB family antitoxin n=1 Tax=Stenotrophomonas maltophilia TaxID=40324 RepID=UPI0018D2869C|nr:type II toxin-antitoxin system HicB family antitoxin [Stenotrophomonas maltophilia]MBH1544520.1 type II toxin-antitoxin system HicB family antitoxin [Stenotrophomonas maltophilia]
MIYPAKLSSSEDGGFVVTFRDIPEAITQGDTKEEAVEMAAGALATAMEFYFEDRRTVPLPSELQRGEVGIPLPAGFTAKVLLLNEMIAKRVTRSELARRLGTSPQVVNRIVNLGHPTKIDTIDEALRALGARLDLSVQHAA